MSMQSAVRFALLSLGSRRSSLRSALLLATALAACGGGGDDDGVEGTCSATADAICSAACECGGSAGCSIGDESGSITFDSKAECLGLYSLACQQPSSGFDYAACETALKTPICVQSPDGRALETPAECQDDSAQ